MSARGSVVWGVACAAAFQFAPGAQAVSIEEISAHCAAYLNDPAAADGEFCAGYVQGFLEGASLARPSPTQIGSQERESWEERAARTRLGKRPEHLLDRVAWCVPDGTSMYEIVQHLLQHIADTAPEAATPAGPALESVLLQHYPCRK